jgi:hypothetical protein
MQEHCSFVRVDITANNSWDGSTDVVRDGNEKLCRGGEKDKKNHETHAT